MARHDLALEVIERHPDPRGRAARPGRSVNLTLCARGFPALDAVGIGDEIRSLSVPVHGRVIHGRGGELEYQPYGNRGECLYSISRHRLWLALLDQVDRAGVPIRFGHRCASIEPEQGEIELETSAGTERRRVDLIVAADGARSPIRHSLIRRPQQQYSQRYSDHANKELRLPAAAAREAGLDPHALHIWPRGQFMLIAFPNLDGSLTCTLHLPLRGEPSFGAIRDGEALERLFAEQFPDARPLLPTLVEDYFSHPEIPMVTVRCSPLVVGRTVLIGDAAHALWPSYGQGANSGFEDCMVLSECLASSGLAEGLETYSRVRRVDVDAIADLSEHHFEEIRDQVGDPKFQARKRIERRLNELYPDRYVPLYVRVSFTQMPYSEAVRIEGRQKILVDQLLTLCEARDGQASRFDLEAMEGPEARAVIFRHLENL